jgi:shikimate 5-dehydrogenase
MNPTDMLLLGVGGATPAVATNALLLETSDHILQENNDTMQLES